MLKGVFFQKENDIISLVATDGRRLAVTSKNESAREENNGEFISPSMTVAG